MSLSDKITSKDHPALAKYLQGAPGDLPTLGRNFTIPWYLLREFLRMQEGVYPVPTAVLTELLREKAVFALHVSKEDPTMVAYTPDRAYGEADRQVKTTLGRFLAKYYPHLADETVAALTAEHLSELDTTFEVLTGQALVDVYRSNALATCMSKSDTPRPGDHHPAEVYDMPGIAMAVLRDSEGRINARCLILEEKKLYIRCYGDSKLKSKLIRSGYKAGGWEGVEFKKIPLGEGSLLMPYLDAYGSLAATKGSCVALIDGKLVGITSAVNAKLLKLFGSSFSTCSANTGGRITLREVPMDELRATCAISGVALNLLTDVVHDYWDGSSVVKVSDAVASDNLTSMKLVYGGYCKKVLCHPDTPYFYSDYTQIIDIPESRSYYGFNKLAEALYPDDREWYRAADLCETADGYIRVEDRVVVIEGVDDRKVHKSKVQKDWVKVHSTEKGVPYYATADTPVVKTVTGRKVVMDYHAVEKTRDGVIDFRRNLQQQHMPYFGNVWRVKGTPPIATDSDYIIGRALEEFEAAGNKMAIVKRVISRTVTGTLSSYLTTSDQLRGHSGGHYYTNNRLYRELVNKLQVWEAEANAVDYNLPPATEPVSVEQPCEEFA